MRYIRALFGVFIGSLFLLPAADPSRSVWDQVYTIAQAQNGADLYEERCTTCHGEPETGGDSGPALAGDGFLDDWNGKTVGDLFAKVSKTMPMDAPGSLKPDEYASLLAFIFTVNHFPAGSQVMPSDEAVLRQIRIEPKK